MTFIPIAISRSFPREPPRCGSRRAGERRYRDRLIGHPIVCGRFPIDFAPDPC